MKYLIIGGVAGGATAAARIRRNDEHAEILIFEKGGHISYANCGLPYYLSGVIDNRNRLFLQSAESFMNRYEVDVRIYSKVERIDVLGKNIEITDTSSSRQYAESYDKLLISPGAMPFKPCIEGIDHPKVFTIRTVQDIDLLKSVISAGQIRNAIVVGGGFIGLEMVENMHNLGISIDLVEMSEHVLSFIDCSMASMVHSELKENGIRLHLESSVGKIEECGDRIKVILVSGQEIEGDLIIWSTGVRPETGLAAGAGLKLGITGGISVNKYLQTSNEDIYAVGDAIEVVHVVTGKPLLIPLAGPANKQARIAADNMVYDNCSTYDGTMGASIVKIFGLTVAAAGASSEMLEKNNIPFIASYTHSFSHSDYYPGAVPFSIKILFSPNDGRLLGAQAVGSKGVDKRIEMFAQIIGAGGTVYDLTRIEHAYAPPYSSAKEPVNVAGYVAENILRGNMKIVHRKDIEEINLSEDFLIDVRSGKECMDGMIRGAVNIPLDELRLRLDEIPTDKRIILYCAVGKRGYMAYRILVQNGFDNVYNLSGGYSTYCKDIK